jgi:hypothetical protein
MPFDPATSYIKNYMLDRNANLINTRRLKWSTNGQSSFKAMIDDLFDGTPENDQWETMRQLRDTSHPNPMIGIRCKIAWLAACNRDLRTQFASASGCRERVALDQVRYGIMRIKWAFNGFLRFLDIVRYRLTP